MLYVFRKYFKLIYIISFSLSLHSTFLIFASRSGQSDFSSCYRFPLRSHDSPSKQDVSSRGSRARAGALDTLCVHRIDSAAGGQPWIRTLARTRLIDTDKPSLFSSMSGRFSSWESDLRSIIARYHYIYTVGKHKVYIYTSANTWRTRTCATFHILFVVYHRLISLLLINNFMLLKCTRK